MIHRRLQSITRIFVLLVSSASFLLGVGPALADSLQFRDRGVQVNIVPSQPNGQSDSAVASATCDVQVNQRNVILHFAATPFVHLDDSSVQADAVLSATVSRQLGRITISPQRVIDQTNVSNDDQQATIAVGVSGNGRAQVQMQIGIDAKNAHAGRHSTTVTMTVTAN